MSTLLVLLISLLSSAEAPHILFLGDSLTEGYGIPKDQAYPAHLQKMLAQKGLQIQADNAGISGSTSASGESRLRWHLKKPPQLIFLALGANDGLRGLPVSEMEKNLEKVILIAKEKRIPLILAGMKMPMNYGGSYRNQYEAVFTRLAKKHSLEYVPFLLDGVATIRKYNLPDGIHPNEAGHKIMAEKLLPIFEKAIKGLRAAG